MYNRYIPQPDGSYRKDRIPDAAPPQPRIRQQKTTAPQHEHEQEKHKHPQDERTVNPPIEKPPQHYTPKHTDAGDFLRRLLPKDLDTGDLLIVVLLLLMAGDSKDDKNTALLTLALYFFL